MGKRLKRLTIAQIEHALRQASGNVSYAAEALGVGRSTLYRRIQESAVLQQVLQDAREELVDIAEDALKQEVRKGNVTAIIFTLKTLGRSRGYIERAEHEITGAGGGAVVIRVEGLMDDGD